MYTKVYTIVYIAKTDVYSQKLETGKNRPVFEQCFWKLCEEFDILHENVFLARNLLI